MTHPVVLGLGGTVDFELRWDAPALELLAADLRIRREELDEQRPIAGERDLVVTLLAFLARGGGGERFVLERQAIFDLAERFGYDVTLGGTGVRAGLAARLLGVGSTQHLVSIDDTVRRLLPAEIDYICSSDTDSLDPHLIVQYPEGARIVVDGAVLTASRENRIIYTNDPPNRLLALSERLPDALEHASLFVVSGFNSMQEADLLAQRVGQLRTAMRRLPDDALVIFEDAGYHEPSYGPIVLAGLADQLDVYSLNEDELQLRVGRAVDLLDPDDVRAALAQLRASVPTPVIVLHTRHYALAEADDPVRWLPVLDGGVVMSGTRYAHGDAMTADDLRRTAAAGRRSAAGAALVAELTAGPGVRIGGVAAFDLDDVSAPTTIGLGDSFIGGMVAALELERRAHEPNPA